METNFSGQLSVFCVQNASEGDSSQLRELFKLSEEEQILEQFACKMLQAYACTHNTCTPSMQMAFAGTMSVTDQRVCFAVSDHGKCIPVTIELKTIVQAVQSSRLKEKTLKLQLEGGSYAAFGHFATQGQLESAVALIEHLLEGCE